MAPSTHLPLLFLYTARSEAIEGATRFQKMVFLAQKEHNLKEYYEFRSDRFGPYSVDLRSDLEELEKRDYIERNVETTFYGNAKIVYSLTPEGVQKSKDLLTPENRSVFDLVEGVKEEYNQKDLNDLLKYVYTKYNEYVEATDLDTTTLFDPDAQIDTRKTPKREPKNPSQLGDILTPTPHTLYQMPKRGTNAYFYYFTDSSYTEEDSKFFKLDEQLTLFGRRRSRLEVAIIDRDRMRDEMWDVLVGGFDIENYPALVVAEEEVGVRGVDLSVSKFVPSGGTYAKIENGIISDSILDDSDDVRDFLNALYDCARRGEIEEGMRKEKITQSLKIGKDGITDILSVTV
jgi:uncharacterized protein YwgA